MTKQKITVQERDLQIGDVLLAHGNAVGGFLVEREVPAEPTPEPGTKGTADLTNIAGGNKALGLPCMKTNDGYVFPGATVGDDSAVYRVSNFVPDGDSGALRIAVAQWDEARNALVEVGKFVAEIDTDILHDGSYVEILRAEFGARDSHLTLARNNARLALEQRDEARAEVERLGAQVETQKGIIQSWQNIGSDYNLGTPKADHQTQLATALLPLADAPDIENVPAASSMHALLGAVVEMHEELRQIGARLVAAGMIRADEPDATPEPRPAFVLPEREAVRDALRATYAADGYIRGQVDAVLALLAEHAVTEERLAEALRATAHERERMPSWDDDARLIFARLTGKAEG